jgi:aspartate kinase
MKIFKFGGASVKDAEGVRNVAGILQSYSGEQVLVVISAMGKITNLMEDLVFAYFNNTGEVPSILKRIREFHYDILKELGDQFQLYNDVDNLLLELECMVENPNNLKDFDFVYDQIVCFGELLSTRIVSNYLLSQETRNQWIDARNFIITDNRYRDSKIDWDKTEHLISNRLKPLAEKHLVITQGFIGRDSVNATTTLGREGSDYSAAIFAYCLHAESVTIWKDVAGVMNADPRKFATAQLIPELSYNDSIELAYYGASVIHPKTIQPLKARNIPLYVRSFIKTDAVGTTVSNAAGELDVPCYIHKSPQMMVELSTRDFTFIVEDTLKDIFTILAEQKVRCNIMQNSAISFSFVADQSEDRLGKITGILNSLGLNVTASKDLELLTVYQGATAKVDELIQNKTVVMEQRTGQTVHYALKNK